jgi:putative heme-binding domain-containing protein
MRIDAIRTLRKRHSADAHRLLHAIALDDERAPAERAEAAVGLAAGGAADRALLIQLASDKSSEVSHEALRNLRGIELTDAERKELGDQVSEVSPPTGHPPAKDVAAWLKYAEGEGDAAAGERLFFHGKIAACARCHEFEGRGQQIGPDLTTIGRTLTRERLVQSIVDPSREIAPQFTPFVIATTDGNVKTGTYVGEEVDGTVRYADATGQIFKIHPRDVEQRKPSPVSIMPDNLATQLTQQELRDLLAFLLGERGASAP